MNALMRKKKEWEFQNERYFISLVETSADVSIESVKKAGRVTSFLIYLAYKITRMLLAIVHAILNEPRLVRYESAEKAPEQLNHEIQPLNSYIPQAFNIRR